MQFRVLGPLEVLRDGEPLALGGDRQRALLLLLLLHRREVVASDTLIDDLWDGQAPPSATKTLHAYVSRLRKVLANGALETHGHGYRLAVAPEDVDADRFERLVGEARESAAGDDRARARRLLEEALGLWRGPPLADVTFEPFAAAEIARLEELRLVAREELADARLALGEHRELVPELEAAVLEHPTRERLVAQLMLALYRSGAQADALDAYRRARGALVDDLGVEPSPELRRLEQRILEQDPAMEPPARPLRARRRARARRRGGLLVAAGGMVLAAAAGAAIVASGGGEDGRPSVRLAGDAVGLVDARTGELTRALGVRGRPGRLAARGGSLWVAGGAAREVAEVDVRRGVVARVVPVGAVPADVVEAGGSVWVLDRARRALVEVPEGSGRIARRVLLGGAAPRRLAPDRAAPQPWSLAAGGRGVWVTDGSRRIVEVDVRRGRVARRVDAGRAVVGAAALGGDVWAISHSPPSAIRIDRSGRVAATVRLAARAGDGAPRPVAIEAGPAGVWVLSANTATVSRIDPRLGAVTSTVAVGERHHPAALAAGRDAVWVASRDGALSRVDARTNAVRTTVVARALTDVALAGGGVWVSAAGGARPGRAGG